MPPPRLSLDHFVPHRDRRAPSAGDTSYAGIIGILWATDIWQATIDWMKL